MNVMQADDGTFSVIGDDGKIHGCGLSNAAAWRMFDRINNEPINKREDTADWSFRRSANGE